jgi:ATP-dependent Lhr-like helicase
MMKRLTAAALAATLGFFAFSTTPAQAGDPYWQCVTFARMFSGIQIFGDAWTWWRQAVSKFRTGDAPETGSVLVFQPHGRMSAGHVAVVSDVLTDRVIRVTHANWGGSLGKVEERFAAQLSSGDTFFFAGMSLEVESLKDMDVLVRAAKKSATIPSYGGLRLPLTTHLSARVQAMLDDRAGWGRFPDDVREWLEVQDYRSRLPAPGELLVESFPHHGKHYTAYYTFEGWNANQSLGMLITRRMETAGLKPLGFVANDYAIATYSIDPVTDPAALFSPDIH